MVASSWIEYEQLGTNRGLVVAFGRTTHLGMKSLRALHTDLD